MRGSDPAPLDTVGADMAAVACGVARLVDFTTASGSFIIGSFSTSAAEVPCCCPVEDMLSAMLLHIAEIVWANSSSELLLFVLSGDAAVGSGGMDTSEHDSIAGSTRGGLDPTNPLEPLKSEYVSLGIGAAAAGCVCGAVCSSTGRHRRCCCCCCRALRVTVDAEA